MWAPCRTPWASAASVPASLARGGRPVSAPTKSLREIAISSGRPSSCRRATSLSRLDRLRGRLGEVGAGVDDQLLGIHAAVERDGDALAQEVEHLCGDVA